MPQISVIVPVYKVEKYIHRCVDSILGQTYTDFELILVDDGSPDNCGVICEEYAAKDSRIVVIHQENGGLSAARNAGIEWAFAHSDSQWLAFVDSDDWIHAQFLEKLLSAALTMNTVVSCCWFQKIKDGEEPEAVIPCVPRLCAPEDVYCAKSDIGVNAYAWRFLYQKKLFEGVAFPCGKIYEDLFTTHKLIFKTNAISVVEQPLYYYFQRDDSIVHSKWMYRHLDKVEAYEAVVSYFDNTGISHVKLCAKRGYIFEIYSNYLSLLESNCEDKRRYELGLRKKMRIALFRYAKDAGFHFKTEHYLYAIACPKLVAIYWHIRAILEKFKRK